MKITFIQTGGTIDKDYPQGATNHGYEFEITEPAFISIFKRTKPDFEYDIISLFKKDSLDITSEDLELLLNTIEKLTTNKVVITHGTDTIHKTAEKLSVIKDKTIILTGAMLPEKFTETDADFNLGMAIGGAQFLGFGTYICLFGKIVSWDSFRNK